MPAKRRNHKNQQPFSRRGRSPRRLSIRSELRGEPDVRKYARAVIALAMAQAEREAEAQRAARQRESDGEPRG